MGRHLRIARAMPHARASRRVTRGDRPQAGCRATVAALGPTGCRERSTPATYFRRKHHRRGYHSARLTSAALRAKHSAGFRSTPDDIIELAAVFLVGVAT